MNTARNLSPSVATEPLEINVTVGLAARDQIQLRLKIADGVIHSAQLTAVGCTPLLKRVEELRSKLKGKLDEVALPEGADHAAMLLRETLLKAQGSWKFPYAEEELCHCRAVATAKVDGAIIAGCHSVDSVKAATSASTSCGTCRPDVDRILAYRMNLPQLK